MVLIIAILLLLLELIYFKIAYNCNIVDVPNVRSSHNSVTLRGGGIIFLFAPWLYALFFNFDYIFFLLGLTVVAIISFIDDIKPQSDRVRLVVQIAAMLLVFYQLGLLDCSKWWLVGMALIVCVGIANAYNFMDGINGMTGGYSLAVVIPLMVVNSQISFIDPHFLYVIALCLVIFCFFNFRKKAVCFAGDVGSFSIAFILIFLLGKVIVQTGDFTYIIFLALYGVDTVLTILHRVMLKENLGKAHRKHAYQIMSNELKMPHLMVSSIYMMMQLIISLGLLFIPVKGWIYDLCVLIILCALYIWFMRRYYYLHENYLQSKQK